MSRLLCLALLLPLCTPALAKSGGPKVHTVALGPMRRVPFTPAYATADTKDEDSTTLRIRALFVDERQKEWTLGDQHAVTDRSFAIRRALRVNDSLPNDPGERWVWQPGPWLLVDRITGHITPLHLPDFDPSISNVVWFRDYAAYCGVSSTTSRSSGQSSGLVAIIAQVGARKPVAQRSLGKWPQTDQPDHPIPACKPATWQRLPMRATLAPSTGDPITFDIVGSTSLIEEGDNDD